jgi:hypothetical protein
MMATSKAVAGVTLSASAYKTSAPVLAKVTTMTTMTMTTMTTMTTTTMTTMTMTTMTMTTTILHAERPFLAAMTTTAAAAAAAAGAAAPPLRRCLSVLPIHKLPTNLQISVQSEHKFYYLQQRAEWKPYLRTCLLLSALRSR